MSVKKVVSKKIAWEKPVNWSGKKPTKLRMDPGETFTPRKKGNKYVAKKSNKA